MEQQDLVTGRLVKRHRGFLENRPRNLSPVTAMKARLQGPPPSSPRPPGISKSAAGPSPLSLALIVDRILLSITPVTETTSTARSIFGAEREERGWGFGLSNNGDSR